VWAWLEETRSTAKIVGKDRSIVKETVTTIVHRGVMRRDPSHQHRWWIVDAAYIHPIATNESMCGEVLPFPRALSTKYSD